MTTIQHTITIDRSLQEVWDYVLDTRNDPVWQPHVIGVGRGADAALEVGLEIEETIKFLGRTLPVTLTVTEHDPLAHSAIEVSGGPVTGPRELRLRARRRRHAVHDDARMRHPTLLQGHRPRVRADRRAVTWRRRSRT